MPLPKFVPFSVLDLSFVREGEGAGEAIRDSLALARHVERLGFHRFWLAEHHNMAGIASAATSVVIGYIANGTSTIRVGAGGVMLPNHSPLVIAEQFGTLESLYPGRIDLGLGRAPGTDMTTSRALRRQLQGSADTFPDDVQELIAYFEPPTEGQKVHAFPGEGLRVPVWLLGSSTFSARLAAALGLPFAFASHFAPDHLIAALEIYRREFRGSEACPEPYAMAAVNVFAADSDEEAARLFTSAQMGFLSLLRGKPGKLKPPVDSIEDWTSAEERAMIERTLRYSFVGKPSSIQPLLERFISETGIDELIVTGRIYDSAARQYSFELLAQVRDSMPAVVSV
jgi:luciferase family oxidoreductase group 1